MQPFSLLGFIIQIAGAALIVLLPDQSWTGWGLLAIAALSTVALFGWMAFRRERAELTDRQKRFVDVAFGSSVVFPMGVCAVIWAIVPRYAERMELQISFPAENANPTDRRYDNVSFCYTYHWPATTVEPNKETRPGLNITMGEQWFVVIIFNRPVKYNRVNVFFSGNLPPYEILRNDQRLLLLAAHGALGPGELEISTENKN